MSDDITRIALDTALDADQTDWARLRAIDDADIDAAIAADADTFAIGDPVTSLVGGAGYSLWQDGSGGWAWVLMDDSGERIAVSGKSYASSEAASAAIEALRSIVSATQARAA